MWYGCRATSPWNSKSACEKRMKLPNFTDAFSVQHTCPLSCCSSSFSRFGKFRHSFFLQCATGYICLSCNPGHVPEAAHSLPSVIHRSVQPCSMPQSLPMHIPLMQNAVSAMKIPVCPHFRLCPVFTWTSLPSQQVGFTPSSFTRTIPSAPIEATISSPARCPHI